MREYTRQIRLVVLIFSLIAIGLLSAVLGVNTAENKEDVSSSNSRVLGLEPSDPVEIPQYYPYAEWSVTDVSYSGNPYDISASVTFTLGLETRVVPMFYDGDTDTNVGTWKFRFNGDLVGDWTFVSSSSDPGDINNSLDGLTGSVNVIANENNVLKRGFIEPNSSDPNKWSRSGLGGNYAFSPTYVMAASPSEYYLTPGKLDTDLNKFLYNHNEIAENQTNYGFDGFNMAVYCRWFDIEAQDGRCDFAAPNEYNNNNKKNPDRRTFASLEQIITETYERGGVTHLWMWGDKLSNQNPTDGSYGEDVAFNSVTDRLYNYMIARLGAIPGWTIGYGNNPRDWISNVEIEYWYDFLNNNLDWPHLITAQGKLNDNDDQQIDGNLNNNLFRIEAIDGNFGKPYGLASDSLNTYSWADAQPSYNFFQNLINSTPVSGQKRPHFSELRFIVGDYDTDTAQTYLTATRTQIYALMSGGLATIWGNVGSPYNSAIVNGTDTSLEFDSTNHFSGSVNNVAAVRQHPGGGSDTSAYDARQFMLNRAIIANRYLRADMTNCTNPVIRDSQPSELSGGDISLNDGSGVCLESPVSGDEIILIFEENVGPTGDSIDIQMDLSDPDYDDITNVRAVDLNAPSYTEIDITGIGKTANEAWAPPNDSDWLLILNVDDGISRPDAINDLVATPIDQAVGLNWTEPNDNGSFIIDYQVEYRLQGEPTWEGPYSTGSTSNTFTVMDSDPNFSLNLGSTYEFRVYAVNGETTDNGGISDPSNEVSATIISIPAQINPVNTTSQESSINLNWSEPVTNGSPIIDYIVEYKVNGDPEFVIYPEGQSSVPSAQITGLSFGTTYDFRVAAVNSAGQGPYSSVVSASPAQVPDAISDLIATAGTNEIDLSWTAPAANNSAITDYVVEYRSGVDPFAVFDEGVSTATTATVTGLNSGIEYDFRVSAVNGVGQAAASNIAQATPLGEPAAVDDLAGTADVDLLQINLTWSEPADGGYPITDYIVEYKLSSDSSYSVFNDGVSASTGASVTGLTLDEQYDFRVAAVNSIGNSAYSNVATIRLSPNLTTTTVYRFYNIEKGIHFYTASENEKNKIINTLPQYLFEGKIFTVFEEPETPDPDIVPVYRFYNVELGTHFYTASETEKNKVINTLPQYIFEGPNYYVSAIEQEGMKPVYRFYNTEIGIHFYTGSESEKNKVINTLPQYNFEGPIYYILED